MAAKAMKRIAVLAALLAFCGTAPTRAGDIDPEVIRATAGWWFLAESATGSGCNLKLTAKEAIGGYAVEVASPCKIGEATGDDFAAWNFSQGQMIFIDPVRHVLFRLNEQEYGAYTSDDADPQFVLTPSADGISGLPVAGKIYGTWQLARPNAPALCTLTLKDRPPPGGEESFEAVVAPGCDPAVASLKLAAWRVEGVYLVLYGTDGRSLSFQADGKGGFAKAAKEGGKPLLMTRTSN
ncbi:MAG TPA: AprI/Inh family metalloprotease inhibitor [Bauldia sp.]|nr:AprI/Inh family metalloprotease inhibitor [Bauldia sp.]